MIFDMRRRGLSISAIARKTGLCRKTIRQHLKRGLENPVYGPRHPRPRLLDPYEGYLRERVESCPGLSGKRLFREIREFGYEGGYTAVTDCLREIRPVLPGPFERRFETGSGRQAQVDFAEFSVEFGDEPRRCRKVWLFSLVLGNSRWLWDVSVRTRSWKRYCVVTSWRLKPVAASRPPLRSRLPGVLLPSTISWPNAWRGWNDEFPHPENPRSPGRLAHAAGAGDTRSDPASPGTGGNHHYRGD